MVFCIPQHMSTHTQSHTHYYTDKGLTNNCETGFQKFLSLPSDNVQGYLNQEPPTAQGVEKGQRFSEINWVTNSYAVNCKSWRLTL